MTKNNQRVEVVASHNIPAGWQDGVAFWPNRNPYASANPAQFRALKDGRIASEELSFGMGRYMEWPSREAFDAYCEYTYHKDPEDERGRLFPSDAARRARNEA